MAFIGIATVAESNILGHCSQKKCSFASDGKWHLLTYNVQQNIPSPLLILCLARVKCVWDGLTEKISLRLGIPEIPTKMDRSGTHCLYYLSNPTNN